VLLALTPCWVVAPAAAETQSFTSPASAAAAGWTGVKNTTGGSDFTWKDSNVAGGTPGEAGGTFKRVSSGNAGWFADVTLGGTLSLTNSFSASGRLVLTNAATADQHWWLGHFGTHEFDGSPRNLVGFRFSESSASAVRVETVAFLKNGTERTTGTTVVNFTGGNVAFFDYTYNPSLNSGRGRLVANLRNAASNTVYTGTLNLFAGDKTTGAALNAFGMAEGGLASDGSNFIDMFVDDVTYSTATPTFPVAQFEFATSEALEGGDPVLLRVVLSQVQTQTVTVAYAVTGGTATGGGVDYTLAPGPLVFPPGETDQFISLATVEDGLEEPDETILIALTDVTGGVQLGNPSIHAHTILAPPPPFAVQVSSSGEDAVFTWPSLYAGHRLQYRPDLVSPPSWVDLTNVVTLTNDLRQVVVEQAQPGFYRAGHLVNSLGMEFVWIEPGTFTMGVGNNLKLPDSVADFDEQPAHAVALTQGFYLLKEKVSPSQYAAAGLPGSPDDVSWQNAAAFCAWLSQHEGRTYRLPTEAEWHYARLLPQGATNLSREWVNDWHHLYPHDSVTNPVGPAHGLLKVIRTAGQTRFSLSPDATSSPWGFAATGFRVVLDSEPTTNVHVTPPPFNQSAVKHNPGPALLGPDPGVPYFTIRFALPLPPDNDRNQNGPLTGLDQSVVDHNHSPGFEVLPNGDALAVWFSGMNGEEFVPTVRIVQARLRHGAEEFDMPELLYKIKGYNDESPCLWRDGTTNWLFAGGRMGLNEVPFKVGLSTNNGANWTMHLPRLTGSPNFGNMTAQPINSAFRAPDGAIYFAMDGGGADSFLWRSLDGGLTWNDQLGRTSGRHSTIEPLDGAGNLLSYGGKSSQINGYMPQNLSANWGATWQAPTQSPFPQLGGNQRPSLWRLSNGKLVMVGDSQLKGTTTPPAGWTNGVGAYVAISADNGGTWHIKALPVTLPHEGDRLVGTLGYATVRQAPNGVIHVLTTMTHPCVHYEFNEAWIYSNDGDVPPETAGGTVQSFSEHHPGGGLRATWSARVTPNGRYLLDGLETTFHENGHKEYEATWVSGRRTGTETFWSQDGRKVWSWTHDPGNNTSTWDHYWNNGRKRVESTWNTHPVARDLPTRNFRGRVAHGPAYHWNADGTGRAGFSFSNGTLVGTLPVPPPQP
jgi:hypothetical protein